MPSSNGVPTEANGIEVSGLVREFKGGVRAVDGIDLEVAAGRDLRLPRPERRRQVDHRPHADHPAPARPPGRRGWPGTTSSRRRRRSGDAIGVALQEAALDPNQTGREHMRLQGALYGHGKAEATSGPTS